jgi:SAM-dependent methyltransferase
MGQNQVPDKGERPSAWITRFSGQVPAEGGILDLACGGGRHGRLFLELGRQVLFLDRDLAGVADLRGGAGAELLQADLENGSPWPLPGRHFAGLVVSNYLWRPLFPHLIGATAPGGLLLYETFMLGQEKFGRPANPDFLLRRDELFECLKADFDILAFEQGEEPGPRPAMRQRIAAVKR